MSEELTDEFVARALAKEARDSTIKYSAMGLEAFLPKRPPTNHPKPNTRFLRNIIKETDTHNAALLAKEAQESKARLEEFSTKQRGGDIRRRQLGDIAAILGGSPAKRRKLDKNAANSERGVKRRLASSRDDASGRPSQRGNNPLRRRSNDYEVNDDEKTRSSRSSRSSREDESKTSRHQRRPTHKHDYEESADDYSKRHEKWRGGEDDGTNEMVSDGRRRHRSRSPSRERVSSQEGRRHPRLRSYSPTLSHSDEEVTRTHHSRHKIYNSDGKKRKHGRGSRSPSISEEEKDHSRRHRTGRDKIRPCDSPSSKRRRQNNEFESTAKPESDSDPLDEIIGPRPRPKSPIISRGRGKISAASGIDSRFSSNYDPTADVRLDYDEENDWEQALEALRDRQKWKQQGAERLKAAGFTNEEIKKWESGGEKREEDVKWAKLGEGREWDRGKFVSEDGHVVTGADWGRLK